jgi:predicted dehydrogenase
MEGVKGSVKYQSKDSDLGRDVEDHAFAVLFFENGAVMNLETCWAQHRVEDEKYLEIYGRKGGLLVDPELRFISNDSGFLSNTEFSIAEAADPFGEMFDRELAHFRDCIADGVPCLSPSSDGVRLMRIIDAIYESARLDREVELGS